MNLTHRPLVTVYVPSHNYGHYLAQCLQSVHAQSLSSWELIVIADGSTDATLSVAQEFMIRDPQRVRLLVHERALGLRACANAALELARGDYIMRLDADDFLDENALLVLSHFLDQHPEIGLVYPNWIFVDAGGATLGVERRKRIGAEAQLLDLPAHGACTLIRRRVLKAIGGYDLSFTAQDGHELWLKALHRFGVGHVETPLFSYRQHGQSLSNDQERLLASRRAIKARVASVGRGPVEARIAVIVPVKNSYAHFPNLALAPLAGKPLLDYTLDSVVAEASYSVVLVTTDDPAVVEHCRARGDVRVQLRDAQLSDPQVQLSQVFVDATTHLETELGIYPDIVVVLSVHTPLRRPEHVLEAINTLLLYPVDQVVSTWEVNDLHFRHGPLGMQPINAGTMNALRYEREALYACNGSIHVLWREVMSPTRFLRGRIGHVVMSRNDSLLAKKPDERRFLELLISESAQLPPNISDKS